MTEELNFRDASDKLIFECTNCSSVFRSNEYRVYFNKYMSITGASRITKVYKKKCPNCNLEIVRFMASLY